MTAATPTRTDTQRAESLAKANRVRVYRSELKRNLRAGGNVLPLILDPAPEVATMKVGAVLLALPGWGPVRVQKFMRAHAVSSGKTLGGLSDRQRDELAKALAVAP